MILIEDRQDDENKNNNNNQSDDEGANEESEMGDDNDMTNAVYLQYTSYEDLHNDIQLFSTLTSTQWIDRTKMSRAYTTEEGLI